MRAVIAQTTYRQYVKCNVRKIRVVVLLSARTKSVACVCSLFVSQVHAANED